MKVTFKKRRYYKGKLREIGETVNMDKKHARAFIRVNAAVPTTLVKPKTGIIKDGKLMETHKGQLTQDDHVTKGQMTLNIENEEQEEPKMTRTNKPGSNNTEKEVENLSYRELQELCKEKELPANGTKEELLQRLKVGE